MCTICVISINLFGNRSRARARCHKDRVCGQGAESCLVCVKRCASGEGRGEGGPLGVAVGTDRHSGSGNNLPGGVFPFPSWYVDCGLSSRCCGCCGGMAAPSPRQTGGEWQKGVVLWTKWGPIWFLLRGWGRPLRVEDKMGWSAYRVLYAAVSTLFWASTRYK